MESGLQYDGRDAFTKCFCSQAHAAFTICCKCEDYPTSHFLVSRKYRQAALEVFYSQNQFRVSWIAPHPQDGNRDCAAKFPIFRQLPIASIPFLKLLILEFDPSVPQKSSLSPEVWEQWLRFLDILHQNATLPTLTLDIHLKEPYWHSSSELRPKGLDAKYAAAMRERYTTLFEPMTILSGLKALFIWMNYDTDHGVIDGRQEQEETLELLVMGESYDSEMLGKSKRIAYSSPWEAMGH